MKKILLLISCAGLAVVQSGCVCQTRPAGPTAYTYTPEAGPEVWYMQPTSVSTRFWYRCYHRLWGDGYSFSNDPRDPDVLRPVLGLDSQFPPAPLPYKSIN